jgi:hypothetical protein
MSNPSFRFRARADETVLQAARRLEAATSFKQVKLVTNPNLKKRQTPNGTVIKYLTPDTWEHPFRVSTSADYIRITPGTVNGLMPYVANAFTGTMTRLNGLDDKGVYNHDDGAVGILRLDKSKINDDGGLYVMVRVRRDKSSGTLGVKSDEDKNVTVVKPEDLQIVQEKEYEGPTASGAANDFGYHPLAFIQFPPDKSVPLGCFQVCYFNLKYDFQDRRATLQEIAKDPDRLTIGRHIFYIN